MTPKTTETDSTWWLYLPTRGQGSPGELLLARWCTCVYRRQGAWWGPFGVVRHILQKVNFTFFLPAVTFHLFLWSKCPFPYDAALFFFFSRGQVDKRLDLQGGPRLGFTFNLWTCGWEVKGPEGSLKRSGLSSFLSTCHLSFPSPSKETNKQVKTKTWNLWVKQLSKI